jgi:Leucine-rich repeat (LRR) protein
VERVAKNEKPVTEERLDYARKNLTYIPPFRTECNIKMLDFQNNYIAQIENLENLKQLVFLDLYNNQIQVLMQFI